MTVKKLTGITNEFLDIILDRCCVVVSLDVRRPAVRLAEIKRLASEPDKP